MRGFLVPNLLFLEITNDDTREKGSFEWRRSFSSRGISRTVVNGSFEVSLTETRIWTFSYELSHKFPHYYLWGSKMFEVEKNLGSTKKILKILNNYKNSPQSLKVSQFNTFLASSLKEFFRSMRKLFESFQSLPEYPVKASWNSLVNVFP